MPDKDTFNNLASTFDMNNEFTMPKEAEEFKEKKNELVKRSEKVTLEDKEFLQDEIKQLIYQGKCVLDKINKDLKLGSQPRMFEVYGSVFNSVMTGIKELRELNKNVADIEIKHNPSGGLSSVNLKLTAKELATLVKDTTKEMNNAKIRIEAKETITEDVK
jgi:hypothetical protein